MSSLENYDGLCGCIYINSIPDQQIRCRYELGHEGPHSYEKLIPSYQGSIRISGQVIRHPVEEYTQGKK